MSQQLQLSEFNLDGYNVFSQGLDDPTARGLILYVAADINASVVEIPSTFRESLFLNINTFSNDNSNKTLFGIVYRSPNSLNANDERLYDLIDYIEHSYKIPKIIVGDFNFSNIFWYPIQHFGACAKCSGLSDNELKFVNTLRKNSLLQHVVKPTRQRGSDTPHTLDLLITSDNFVSDIDYLSPLGMSDHCVLKFSSYLQTKQAKTLDKFKLDKGDYTKLKEFLNLNWDKMLDPSKFSIDEMWEKFKLIMLEGMNKFIPRRGKRNNASKKNFQPYNKDLHQLIRRKHRLWNRWIQTRDEHKFTEYKTVRNAVKRETIKLIQQEQGKISIECKSNPKKFWQYINRKTGLK